MNKLDQILLIHKKLSGQITREESILLSRWLEVDQNQQLANSIEKTWQASEGFGHQFQPDVNAALEKTKAKLKFKEAIQPKQLEETPIRRISWLPKIAAAVALFIGLGFLIQFFNSDQQLQIHTTLAHTEQVQLMDGSIVWLNENSQLSYPESFTGKSRNVKLKGEAFFEIKKNPSKPFIVETNSATVEVLGTSFNVRAYDHEPEMAVHVKTGHVAFSALNHIQELFANDKAVLDKQTNNITKVIDVNHNTSAWQSHLIKFKKTTILEVGETLEQFYGVSVEVSPAIQQCVYSGSFNTNQTNIGDIFKTIENIYPGIDIKRSSNNHYMIAGDNCN